MLDGMDVVYLVEMVRELLRREVGCDFSAYDRGEVAISLIVERDRGVQLRAQPRNVAVTRADRGSKAEAVG